MAERELTYEDLLQIVDLIKSTSQFTEFRLKVGDIEVSLRRADGNAPRPLPATPGQEPVQTLAPAAWSRERQFAAGAHVVRAPMVGTLYRASAPGAPPFVEVGQEVEPDTTVCLIEVMKLMSSIPAGARGVVREILVENAAAVEYGEPLMLIEPKP